MAATLALIWAMSEGGMFFTSCRARHLKGTRWSEGPHPGPTPPPPTHTYGLYSLSPMEHASLPGAGCPVSRPPWSEQGGCWALPPGELLPGLQCPLRCCFPHYLVAASHPPLQASGKETWGSTDNRGGVGTKPMCTASYFPADERGPAFSGC